MIEEVGSVVELKGKNVAVVLCQKSSFCKSCAAEGMCHVGEDNSAKLVEVHNHLAATVGDRVKVVTSTKSFLQSSFLLYIVPLIFLVTGAVFGQFLAEFLDNGLDSNVMSAIMGTSFMAASFLIIRIGSSSLAKEAYMPKIVEIIKE